MVLVVLVVFAFLVLLVFLVVFAFLMLLVFLVVFAFLMLLVFLVVFAFFVVFVFLVLGLLAFLVFVAGLCLDCWREVLVWRRSTGSLL